MKPDFLQPSDFDLFSFVSGAREFTTNKTCKTNHYCYLKYGNLKE